MLLRLWTSKNWLSSAFTKTNGPSTAGPRAELTTLQAGRGIAALLVVLYHASGLFSSNKYWQTIVLKGVFGFGFAGVEYFFVLSGFIMLHVHRKDIGKPAALVSYFRKRIERIYPAYLGRHARHLGAIRGDGR